MEALKFRFAFFARHFDKSVHFYRNFLGMEPRSQW
jgi:catechol 2,3-dioxygenase-like lactoylglutathione lyase family enzyme